MFSLVKYTLMSQENVIIRFDKVNFAYDEKKIILDEASFSVRKNSIVTIMGQNGAGKSTIFKLLLGKLKPQSGNINIEKGAKIGIAEQMIPQDKLGFTIKEYLQDSVDPESSVNEGNMYKILKTVNLNARILLASALISEPDVLLLDEPTNNLDKLGIDQLTLFLINYEKTCIVISHDADFLNCFTEGVLNLDVHTHQVEQFVGNYYDVLEEIAAKLERDRQLNARLEKGVKDRFEKINKLGGKSVAMAQLARRIRKDIEEDKEEMVEMRREDRTIPEFTIPNQDCVGKIIQIKKPVVTELVNKMRLHIKGPNGIGKSTLLRSILANESADINPATKVGYYSQDFGELDFEETAFDSLFNVSEDKTTQHIYSVAARFLFTGELLKNKIAMLSEGQKGLLCYARFVLQVPGLLILDEPTNHINFRHIPIITKSVNEYESPVIFVNHLPDFYENIKNVQDLDLEKYR